MSDLPMGWVEVELGEIIGVERGSSPRPIKDFITNDDNGLNWVKIGDTQKGKKYITETNEKITPDGAKKSRFVAKGDLILSNSMSLGRAYILDIDGYIHDGWFVLRLPQFISKDFLYYLLSSDFLQNQFKLLSVGGVVNNIRSELVKQVKLYLPPKAEQDHIATLLDNHLSQVATISQKLNDILPIIKQFRQSVLAQAVSGKLIYKNFNQLEVLKNCVNIENGARKPVSQKEREKIQGDYPYYGATGVVDRLNGYTHDGVYILVGEDGANLLTKSKDLAYKVSGKIWVNNHAHVLSEKSGYSLDFIKIIINALDLSKWVTGSAQPKLTKSALEKLPIPKANIDEQQQIVAEVERLFAVADTIEMQVNEALERVGHLTQSILHQAFTGNLSANW